MFFSSNLFPPLPPICLFLAFATVLLWLFSCVTLCHSMDCSLPGSSVHGIPQARILVLPFPPPGDLPNPGIEPKSPALQVDSFAL